MKDVRTKKPNLNRARNIARDLRRKELAASKWAYRRRVGKAVERGTARAKRRHP